MTYRWIIHRGERPPVTGRERSFADAMDAVEEMWPTVSHAKFAAVDGTRAVWVSDDGCTWRMAVYDPTRC